jgi:hypothetical protein
VTEQRRITVTPPPRPKVTPGQCDTGRPVCGKPARLYPAGWRCDGHVPHAPKPAA